MASVSEQKRRKGSEHDDDDLLPGLPDHLAQVCLSAVDPSTMFSVCKSWRKLIYSPSFPPFLSLYALMSSPSTPTVRFHSFDPISATWHPLPPPPSDLRILLRHPSFVARNLPVRSISAGGNLLLLAATTENLSPALPRPIAFDPRAAAWRVSPPLAAPRRWCCTAPLDGFAYVASGVGGQFSHEVARSAERWRFDGGEESWERLGDLRDARFSRDAAEAVGWRGRLLMVSVRGGAAMDGAAFDAGRGEWEEIPPGMLAGWSGPAAAMDEDELYVVDELAGALRRYDEGGDFWEEIGRFDCLRGAEQIAAGGGRVCTVLAGGKGIAVVDVSSETPVRVWEVEIPTGLEVLAIHILPRMCNIPV